MTPQKLAIRTYFGKLGLAIEVADIYLSLHQIGPQTISELSRNAHVERTKLYRLIDQLLESGLIEVSTHGARGLMQAAPIANLRVLIHQREQDLRSLQDELQMVEQVLGRTSLSNPAITLQLHNGSAAIEQALQRIVSAKPTYLIVLAASYSPSLSTELQTELLSLSDITVITNGSLPTWLGVATPDFLQSHVTSTDTIKISHTSLLYGSAMFDILESNGEWYGVETRNRIMTKQKEQLVKLLLKTTDLA